MTKWDKILMIMVIFFSVMGIFFVGSIGSNDDHLYVLVEVDGKEYKKISLDHSTETKMNIDTPYGHNVIQIEGEGVRIIESDCKDQLCVKMGKISKTNQTVICLPNRVSIKIISNKSDVDGISY